MKRAEIDILVAGVGDLQGLRIFLTDNHGLEINFGRDYRNDSGSGTGRRTGGRNGGTTGKTKRASESADR